MDKSKCVVELNDFEQRLMVHGLSDFRNSLIEDQKPTEDVNELLLKVIDAPRKKHLRKSDRDER